MPLLYVNVDHVATIRQARRGREPDPVAAALVCELAGAAGITIHLREDRRHIQDHDARRMRGTIRTVLNLEMAAVEEMIRIALDLRPDQVTLVPERREEVTTEGGLDAAGARERVGGAVARLQDAGIPASLFIDPDPRQVEAAIATGARMVEFHTGRYCEAFETHAAARIEAELQALRGAAALAREAGLTINAGHGLNLLNLPPVAAIPHMHELNIGHSIISRAVILGLDRAVRDMIEAIERAAPR